MAKKKKGKVYRYLNYSNAATELETDAGVISRGVASGKIPGGEMQVYVKADDGEFHEVGGSLIKVVDMESLEIEETKVVKFRKKGKV
jgi:hypothetical protein